MEIKTVTGLTWKEVHKRLTATLEKNAYGKVPGGANLTAIKPAYLTEALDEVFGPCGFGWWYVYDEVLVEEVGGYMAWLANIDRLEFYYRLVVEDQKIVTQPILSNGGSQNSSRAYAVRGALTNAIGAAASKLCWQLPVYKEQLGQEPARENNAVQEVLKELTLMARQRLNWNTKKTTDFLKKKGYTKTNLVEQKEAASAVLEEAAEERLQEVLQMMASEAHKLFGWNAEVTTAFLKEKGYTRDNLVVKEKAALKAIHDEQD